MVWKVSLKILSSGILLKTFIHVVTLSDLVIHIDAFPSIIFQSFWGMSSVEPVLRGITLSVTKEMNKII